MTRTKLYNSFADLNQVYVSKYKRLTVRPRRRSYISSMDAIYDYTVGHEFVVSDDVSPFDGCIVSVLDKRMLTQHGYTHATIQYNYDHAVEVKL